MSADELSEQQVRDAAMTAAWMDPRQRAWEARRARQAKRLAAGDKYLTKVWRDGLPDGGPDEPHPDAVCSKCGHTRREHGRELRHSWCKCCRENEWKP